MFLTTSVDVGPLTVAFGDDLSHWTLQG